jgi:LysM repeat protein
MRYVTVILMGILLGSGLMTAKIIGRVNGFPITEKEANAFLKVVTKGKLKYHQLRPKDKKDVVKRLATDALLIGMANKQLSRQERNQVIVNYWLAQKITKITVPESDIRKAYDSNKKLFKGTKGEIHPFEKVKEMISVSLKQKKYVAQLIDKAKITMGKKVIKSPKGGKTGSSKKAAARSTNGKTSVYKVTSGNTLSGIAHKYHITIKELRAMNNMSEKDTLKIGQKLTVPAH